MNLEHLYLREGYDRTNDVYWISVDSIYGTRYLGIDTPINGVNPLLSLYSYADTEREGEK